MNFNQKLSSFNVYRKKSQNDSKQHSNPDDSQNNHNFLSENSNNMIDNYHPKSQFQKKNHKQESDEYYCLTCNAKYDGIIKCRHNSFAINDEENKSSQNLNSSMNQRNKTYMCPFEKCEKKFNLESGLIRHRVVHTGQRPYLCDYENCSQTFNQKSNLNRHKKIHKNQKPFICEKCCKSFTTTTNLKQHSQIHIPKKQQRKHYICEMKGCNKKYLYRCNLKKHKQQHQDPVEGLMEGSDKRKIIKKARFQFALAQSNITLSVRDSTVEDHSEMKFTYDENLLPNAQVYNPMVMLPQSQLDKQKQENQNNQNALQYQHNQMQQQKIEDVLIRNLQEFFFNKPAEISASFYIHPDLIDYSRTIINQVITLLEEKGTKQIRLFVENKDNFTKCVQNMVELYFN